MARFSSDQLEAWLTHLETMHPKTIDMGLERVAKVRDAMALKFDFPVLTIGGTNGKGSVCALLSTILRAAGYRVATYTSPHLMRFNERIAINLQPCTDKEVIESFQYVEDSRGEISLSYFEFATLAAMHRFTLSKVDVAVLEVGLGGRLDAVNVFDPTLSAVVSIDIDHQAYLGDTRERIAYEKAGIYRANKPAFCADPNPPLSLLQYAEEIGADLRLIGRDFGFQKQNEDRQWMSWSQGHAHHHALPFPALRGDYQLTNASLAIAMLDSIHDELPVSHGNIKTGLLEVELNARFQVLAGRPTVVLDVGHNPHAVKSLRASMDQMGFFPVTHAVFGMMADKDIAEVVKVMADRIDVWHLASPQQSRAESADNLAHIIKNLDQKSKSLTYSSIASAWHAANAAANENDRIIVFGSFFTVSEVLSTRES